MLGNDRCLVGDSELETGESRRKFNRGRVGLDKEAGNGGGPRKLENVVNMAVKS